MKRRRLVSLAGALALSLLLGPAGRPGVRPSVEPPPPLRRLRAARRHRLAAIRRMAARVAEHLDPEDAIAIARAYFPELAGAGAPATGDARTEALVSRAAWPLRVTPPGSPHGTLGIATRGLAFRIHRLDGRWPTDARSKARFDGPAHLLTPAGGIGAKGSPWITERVDECRILREPARYAASYAIGLPAAVARIHDAGGYLELSRGDGTPVLRFHCAVARDSLGRTRRGTIEVAGLAPGGTMKVTGTLRIRTRVDARGLEAPIVVDPAWSSTGAMSTPRSYATATMLGDGRVLVAGGTNAGAPLASAEIYDARTGTWSGTGALGTGRYLHTATLLKTGQVLVAGGQSATALASAELYDPSQGSWSPAAAMSTARSLTTATLLPSGRVLVAGGYDGTYLASSELYDPATDAWSTGGLMLFARSDAAATPLADGRVLVAGGTNGAPVSGVEMYTEIANRWNVMGSLSVARYDLATVGLPGGVVSFLGGSDANGPTAAADSWDQNTYNWGYGGYMQVAVSKPTATVLPGGQVLVTGVSGGTAVAFVPGATQQQLPSPTVARSTGPTATLLPSGSVLVAGGSDSVATPELYSPSGDEVGMWEPTAPGLQIHAYGHTAALLPNGEVLVTGGEDAGSGSNPVTAEAEVFDPASGWSPVASMGTARMDEVSALLQNGELLVAGGLGASGQTLDSAELYDAATASWSPPGAMTSPRRAATATLLPSGEVLVAGGSSGSAPLSSAELYDPATGLWSAAASMTDARWKHAAVLLPSGKVLVVGGASGTTSLATAELYDPQADAWSSAGTLANARSGPAATVLPSGQVLVTGGDSGSGFLASSEIYDPETSTWSAAAPMTAARGHHTATLLLSGRVLVAGGTDATGPLLSTDVYDPTTGTWTTGWRLDEARAYQTATLTAAGRVFLCGGQGTAGPSDTCDEYDPFWYGSPYQPVVTSGVLAPGQPATITGTGFFGASSGSSGETNDSPTSFPLVSLMPLEGGMPIVLPATAFSPTSVSVTLPAGIPEGYYRLTVTANAIPGTAVDLVTSDTAPVANDQNVATAADTAVSIPLVATDADGDPLTYAVATQPTHGTLSGTAPALTYTPDAGFVGSDTFTFTANDGTLDSNVATVAIEVTGTTADGGSGDGGSGDGGPVGDGGFVADGGSSDGGVVTDGGSGDGGFVADGGGTTDGGTKPDGGAGTDAGSGGNGKGGPGCGCSTSSGSPGSLAGVLLGLVALGLRRRRWSGRGPVA